MGPNLASFVIGVMIGGLFVHWGHIIWSKIDKDPPDSGDGLGGFA